MAKKNVSGTGGQPKSADTTRVDAVAEVDNGGKSITPRRKKVIKVRVVNPAVLVDGLYVIVYEDDNPNNARIVPRNVVRPPYNIPFELDIDVFEAGEKPFDFGTLVAGLLPDAGAINLAFWSAFVVRKDDGLDMGRVRNALTRAFPDARKVFGTISDIK